MKQFLRTAVFESPHYKNISDD